MHELIVENKIPYKATSKNEHRKSKGSMATLKLVCSCWLYHTALTCIWKTKKREVMVRYST